MSRVVTCIDIAHDAIKMIALAPGPGIPELVRVAYEPLGELGRVEDGPEKFAALRPRIRRLAESSRMPMRETVVAISGRGTMLRYVPVPPIPPWRLAALMKFEATEAASRSNEDAQAGPCAYDYRLLDAPDVEGQSTVLLAMARESVAADRASLALAAGAEDPDIDLAALGLYSAYVHGHGAEGDEEKTVLLLDIGADELNIVIARGGGLYFARHQPGGGRQFTRAISEVLSLSHAAAEDYKRSKARLYADPAGAPTEEAKTVSEALLREAVAIVRAVEGTLLYARAQTRLKDLKIDRVLLSGGGARLEGFADFLGARLGAEVAPLEPLRRVSLGRLPKEELASLGGGYSLFAVPAGLALSRLVRGAARLDLRQPAAKAARDFRRREVYLRAAAVAFAAGLVFWIAGVFRERSVVARALEVAKARVAEDEAERKTLDVARARYAQLRADMDALRERVSSGEDLLRALSQLKKRTPEAIRLVSLSTNRPAVLGESKDAPDKGATFQSERLIYLHGYSRSNVSLAKAYEQVTAYQKSLGEAKSLFEDVKQVLLRDAGANAPGGPDLAEFVITLKVARPR